MVEDRNEVRSVRRVGFELEGLSEGKKGFGEGKGMVKEGWGIIGVIVGRRRRVKERNSLKVWNEEG